MFVRGLEDRRRLAQEADVDVLTGISNRRSLNQSMKAMLSSAVRHDTLLGFLMIDVDNFKAVNDRYGHPVGDEILKGVATRIRSCLRIEDVVARWGGEEFVVLISDTTDEGAVTVAERIRSCIAVAPFVSSSHEVPGTISIGVALSGADGCDRLIERADAALYLAKETGKDRVVSAAARNLTSDEPVAPES
jgi:two-component system cell cycle response regulator